MQTRNLDELVNKTDPGWPRVQSLIKEAENHNEVLPASDPARSNALLATQVTTRSPMGAVIYESGGILVDHAWLRILGSGHPKLPRSLPDWNRAVGNDLSAGPPPFLLVADDVVGGFFAIDGGALGKPGSVFYFAQDTLDWNDMGVGYGDFLSWCLCGDLQEFYKDFRWPDWQTEVAQLTGDQGFSFFPFLSAVGPEIASRHRGVVPVLEQFNLFVDNASNQSQSSK